jgi:GNAT superfamily N-acetyltransferase
MEKLDFEIRTLEKTLAGTMARIRGESDYCGESLLRDGDNRFSATAFLNGNPVGFWNGMIDEGMIPFDFGIGSPFFYSSLIFVFKSFRERGLGRQIKSNQLEFAKSAGCESLYCEVPKKNKTSLNIQKELGARVRDREGRYECCFDLDKLNL